MAATTTPKTNMRIVIDQFLGVDFASEETEVDPRRSPWAPNMVSDRDGRPEKRPGWETVYIYEGERINGIHWAGEELFVHAGEKLYRADGEQQYAKMADARSVSFQMNEKTYFLDGENYLVWDGSEVKPVEGFMPTTTIGREPAGGGTPFEPVNLLTPWRKNSFVGDGTTKEFLLDAQAIDEQTVEASVAGEILMENKGFTVDRKAGKVIFSEAPPDGSGVDNVVITFAKTVSGNREKITKCTICESYGLGNDTRIFFTGNPDAKNVDYQSGLYDPTYFPDTGYTKIGSEETAILGYLKQYGSMVIVKEAKSAQSGLFLRTAEQMEDGSVIFPVKEGLAGVGAVSPYAVTGAGGDALFLSPEGLYALESNAVTQQKSLTLKSHFVNPRLLRENMKEAVAVGWGRYLLIAVGERCYVADTARQSASPAGDYGYEWYYWENIPARIAVVHDGTLYFGSEEGRVMVMQSPQEESARRYEDDGKAISCMWTTPLLTGGNFMRQKSISKKGTGILAKPYARSSGTVFFTTDKTIRQATQEYTVDIFDWEDVDFNRFTFNTRDDPKVIVSPKKFRKVIYFQMGVKNEEVGEGFGILAMMISYTMGNNIRRSYT